MSEKNKPHDSQPDSSPRNHVVIALPDGQMVNAFDMIDHHREREASMNTTVLRSGDVIAFRYEDDGGEQRGFSYEIEQAGWRDIGIGSRPSVSISGTLQGSHLHPEVIGKETNFGGSTYGGSIIQMGTIATGRSPSFFFRGKGEYAAPFISDFEVFRPDAEGTLRPLEPNELDAEARKQLPEHGKRLEQIQELMDLFHFGNYREFLSWEDRQGLPYSKMYESSRYAAEYKGGGTHGNLLGIYDKQTGQWTAMQYSNSGGDDILQVAYADLSGHKRAKVFDFLDDDGHVADSSAIHRSGEAIVTYATSNRYGLEAINYKPGDQESIAMLGLTGNEELIPDPNFEEVNGDKVHVKRVWYLDDLDEAQPDLYDRLEASARIQHSEDGVTTLELGDRVIPLKDPETELAAIIHNMKNPHQARNIGQKVGRLLRRG